LTVVQNEYRFERTQLITFKAPFGTGKVFTLVAQARS